MNNLANQLAKKIDNLDHNLDYQLTGTLTRIVGLTLETVGIKAAIGSKCLIYSTAKKIIEAEVVGFSKDKLYLMTSENLRGVMPGDQVVALRSSVEVEVSDELLGRVIDGKGRPLDSGRNIDAKQTMPLNGEILNPLSRQVIHQPLDVGIRAINSLLTIGCGQRVGLFAGSGVGKSVLLAMMTRYTTADVIVVGLVGERGREVKEFIECNLGETGLKRSVVIASPADTSPLMRLYAALRATCIAEYFRSQGKNVLLLVDSLTRFAQAQRELALSIGEPPATKGYTPSVFAKLSQLVERAGNADQGGGSITAFYTVLTEGDDFQDPIVDAARSILDGHIVLSRELADAAHYPAIDVETSISRVMTSIVDDQQLQKIRAFRRLYSTYLKNRELIQLGAYQAGSDPQVDEAITMWPKLQQFLQQGEQDQVNMTTSTTQLTQLFDQPIVQQQQET